ncbi:MAG: hypothetical protein JO165_04405 [Candidatus Eremiobacteraeota bacterium]|nr:hypothetical protein [Candidatus Eremiobacteraeota bacterium]
MKTFATFALAAGLAALPVASFAQSSGSSNIRRDFEQLHTQMQQIHTAERAQILAALTPAHKALLANVVGQLAVAPTPDYEAAAKRLDAALTPGERQTILNAAANARARSEALMQGAMPMGGPGETMKRMSAPPDAGHILLHLATPQMRMGSGAVFMHP